MKKETLERAIELKAEINRTENCLKGLKNRAFLRQNVDSALTCRFWVI